MLNVWNTCLDCFAGEDAIKQKGSIYLPMTSSQILDGGATKASSKGAQDYKSYKMRAVFHDLYREAVQATIGIMYREPPKIELPAIMEPMLENATLLGENLETVLRNINTQQLTTGRLGLLGDIRINRKDGSTRPVLVIYKELACTNWNDTSKDDEDIDLSLVVLDESGYVMDEQFSWTNEERYRVLALVEETTIQNSEDGTESTNLTFSTSGVYATATVGVNDPLDATTFNVPSLMGEELETIPFTFINASDLSADTDLPPIYGLAKDCLTMYRGEADYRQNLFMQGQDTLVTIGLDVDDDESIRTGAGAHIAVPINGDAKYIGVESSGLEEQRTALENDYKRAIQKAGQLMDSTSRAKESGEALKIRVAAQTATLPQIAKTGAAGLERVLKILAEWYGANPDEVVVTPNLKFSEADLNGQTLKNILEAKGLGLKLSDESIHTFMQDGGITKKTFEEEQEALSNEEPAPGTGIPSPLDDQGV